jgi:hypothetical protein
MCKAAQSRLIGYSLKMLWGSHQPADYTIEMVGEILPGPCGRRNREAATLRICWFLQRNFDKLGLA